MSGRSFLDIWELKQQRRRRVRKRHLKSEFALPQTLSRLFLELNLKNYIKVLEKKKTIVALCPRPRQNVKLGSSTL